MIPENLKKLYTQEQINARIGEMAKEIGSWIENSGSADDRDVLAIPVLRGGIYFFADLSRSIQHSLEVNSIQSWAYQAEENTAIPTGVTVKMSEFPVTDRRILIMDDICDSGNTMSAIHERFMERGAREVKAAVLIQRGGIEPAYTPEWTGFTYDGPDWFVGYGMDDGGKWRNLPEIYIVE